MIYSRAAKRVYSSIKLFFVELVLTALETDEQRLGAMV